MVGPKQSNKEAKASAVESGLFLAELKAIGLEVGTMAVTANKMMPDSRGGDRGRYSDGGGGGYRPSTTSSLPSRSSWQEPAAAAPSDYSSSSYGERRAPPQPPWRSEP